MSDREYRQTRELLDLHDVKLAGLTRRVDGIERQGRETADQVEAWARRNEKFGQIILSPGLRISRLLERPRVRHEVIAQEQREGRANSRPWSPARKAAPFARRCHSTAPLRRALHGRYHRSRSAAGLWSGEVQTKIGAIRTPVARSALDPLRRSTSSSPRTHPPPCDAASQRQER
jgi:hypothetical protein